MHNNKNSHFGELNAWIWIAIPSTARGVLVSLPRFAALAFVGNGLGSNELAALSLAESWGMFWLGTAWNSVYNTTSTLVSQSYGAGKYRAARGWLLLSAALITMLSMVPAIAWLNTVPALTTIGFDPELANLSSTFLIPAIPMIFLNCIIVPTYAYLTATDSPWIATSIELVSCVLEVALQYVFIIGAGGIPSMGLPGAALGCNLASFVCLLLCVAVLFWGWCRPPSDADDALAVVSAAPADDCDLPARSAVLCEAPLDEASDDVCTPLLHFPDTAMSPGTKLRGADPEVYDGDFSVSCGSGNDWELREVDFLLSGRCWRICLKQAVSNCASAALDAGQYTLMSMLAAHLGAPEIAAHNVLLSLRELVDAGLMGMSEATSVRVGGHLGRGDAKAARCAAGVAVA
eukprot:CAMPEP_0113679476 /NCGR_PEP_ID=MMETSP0038_2-20120614/10666_1 /TAXON_ID=2898 /ORGANISM="Cryptomonas paramecium" /LENGTH=403 /DNA_ID=CAMNT_0000597513 /DNA_START=125 /DNA_END=1332 /DNA_ORIENTATION=- /assembly_acc=CAM_ASM_000170